MSLRPLARKSITLVRKMGIFAPNVLAKVMEIVDFAHPIFGPYSIYCAPSIRLLPPPLLFVTFLDF